MEPITFADDYQDLTKTTEIYSNAAEHFIDAIRDDAEMDVTDDMMAAKLWLSVAYCTGKLNGEAGEVAEKVFKVFRDESSSFSTKRRDEIALELGDVLWYVARMSDLLGYRLSDVMTMNAEKLLSRKDRDVLSGSGDER